MKPNISVSAVLPAVVFSTTLTVLPVAAAYAQRFPAPASVVATESSPGVITLTWSAVPGATEYMVGRSVFPDGFRRAAVVRGTIYVDTLVKAGVRHVYAVNVMASGAVRARSNELIPSGGTGALVERPRPRGPVGNRLEGPGIGIVPDDRPHDSLLTPTPDTISAARCSAEANRKQQERARVARRVGRDSVALPSDQPQSERTAAQRAYLEGKCRHPASPGYPDLWYPVADKSGLTYDERVRAWVQLNIIAIAYKHLLQREPTTAEIQLHVPAMQRGKHWRDLWRELAQSAERDERFGYWAPAPLASGAIARTVFGLKSEPRPEMCYGGFGPACGGSVPFLNVDPRWFGRFTLPDGTEFGYVSIGVGVGSILHDNACLVDKTGLNCSGLGAGDLVKTGAWAAALEWNKATWNAMEGRAWREVFGPYPTSTSGQAQFYDDLRPMRARTAYMAPAVSMLTIPVHTVRYTGIETRRTRALKAPSGVPLDDRDVEYCASGEFSKREGFPGRSGWGICR